MATDNSGTVIAVWSSDDDLGGTIGTDRDVLVARSIDNGITWSTPKALNSNATSDVDDDVVNGSAIATDGSGNWVITWTSYNALFQSDVMVSYSTDNGITWVPPIIMSPTSTRDFIGTVITDKNGLWVLVWSQLRTVGGTDYDLLISTSIDNGQNWTATTILNTDADTDIEADGFVQLTTDYAGNWVAVWQSGVLFTESIYQIYTAYSSDNCASWSNPALIGTYGTVPASNLEEVWPNAATDNAGNWVIVWESEDDLGGTIGTDKDILVSSSSDYGHTWSAPRALNTTAISDGAEEDAGPRIIRTSSGQWLTLWNSDNDLGIGLGTDHDILISSSTDNGATWTHPVPLNSNAISDSRDDEYPYIIEGTIDRLIVAWSSEDDLGGTIGTDKDILFTFNIPCTVESIERIDPTPTSADTVQFLVTFSQDVIGVDLSDFALTTAGGITNASIATVDGSGSEYTVTVDGIEGVGTLRLDLVDDDSISSSGIPLAGTRAGNGDFTSGEVYEIIAEMPLIAWPAGVTLMLAAIMLFVRWKKEARGLLGCAPAVDDRRG